MTNTFTLNLVAALFAVGLSGQNAPPKPDASELMLVTLLNEKLSQAKAAGNAGDWSKAIAVMQEATALAPSRDILWFKLGEAYRGAKKYAEAATAYNKAIEIKPFGAYYNNLGEVKAKLGNVQDAAEAYRSAARIDPANAAQYYFNLGTIETNAGDLDDANRAYDEVIRVNPRFTRAYYFKGTNLLSGARILDGKAIVPDEALVLLHKYLDLEPDGNYATVSRQLIDFLGRDIVTTYIRDGQGGQPASEAIPESASQGLLIRKINPSYPELARKARVQGRVILDALIGRNGTVLSLAAVSGNPLLVESALDAVKQWKYKPYMVDDQPVAVQTQMQVTFTLSDSARGSLNQQDVVQFVH